MRPNYEANISKSRYTFFQDPKSFKYTKKKIIPSTFTFLLPSYTNQPSLTTKQTTSQWSNKETDSFLPEFERYQSEPVDQCLPREERAPVGPHLASTTQKPAAADRSNVYTTCSCGRRVALSAALPWQVE